MKISYMHSLLLAVPLLASCALSGGAIKGKLLEQGTNKPIPGGIVLVRWYGHVSSGSIFVEARTLCYHVETSTTDEQGRYQTKAWRQPQKKDYTVKFDYIGVQGFKRGYQLPYGKPQVEGKTYLVPFNGTRKERLENLKLQARAGCEGPKDNLKKLIPLYRALYEEAKSIAITTDDKEIVKSLHYDLDSLELGEAEADKKWNGGEYDNE